MIKIRKIENEDFVKIDNIINKYDLKKEYIKDEKDNTVIMLDGKKITGLSVYKKIEEDTGLIVFIGYDVDFITKSYRDGFFRSILNSILYNKMKSAIIMADKENDDFYKSYGFEKVDENKIQDLKKHFKNKNEVISGYKISIEDFFNKPCNC